MFTCITIQMIRPKPALGFKSGSRNHIFVKKKHVKTGLVLCKEVMGGVLIFKKMSGLINFIKVKFIHVHWPNHWLWNDKPDLMKFQMAPVRCCPPFFVKLIRLGALSWFHEIKFSSRKLVLNRHACFWNRFGLWCNQIRQTFSGFFSSLASSFAVDHFIK